MTKSVLMRYARYISGITPASINRASIAEYGAIVGPYEHCGVRLWVLDLSSRSPTGTFKDWLACVTIAHCLDHGITEFVTQSSGNTGNALVRYAEPHGIKVHLFYPRDSAYKIQPQVAEGSASSFYELPCSEVELKARTARFAEERGLPWLPTFDHQIQANKIRAYLVHDWCREHGVRFSWHAQAISSAYGIFGFYTGWDEIGRRGGTMPAPYLLGAHQGAVAPYYEFLTGESPLPGEPVLEPTLFRSKPPRELLERLAGIQLRCGGCVTRITARRFSELHALARHIVEAVGLNLRTSVITGDYHEKASLIALMGILEQIECGRITPGEDVLVVGTGGLGVIPNHRFAPPARRAAPVSGEGTALGAPG